MSSTDEWPLDYEAIGIVGEGAQGRVYKLRHRSSGALVAAKRFEGDLDGRVLREIEALERLRHPAIVSFVGVARTATGGYVLTELVDGVNLAEIVRTSGGLTAGRALMMAARIADGLAYAAARDVIHRDVKPSNILVCLHDLPKLADFGCAWIGQTAKRLTRDGEWIGTPHYMAPEQILGQRAEPRTDVWGLAASFYEAITGRLPFDGENGAELAAKIEKEPVDLSGLAAIVGEPAARFFGRCLAKRTDDRPGPEEVAVELAKLARRRETNPAL